MKTNCVGLFVPIHSCTQYSTVQHSMNTSKKFFLFIAIFIFWQLGSCLLLFSLRISLSLSTNRLLLICFYVDVEHNTFSCASDLFHPVYFLSFEIFFENFHFVSSIKWNSHESFSWFIFLKNFNTLNASQFHGNSKKEKETKKINKWRRSKSMQKKNIDNIPSYFYTIYIDIYTFWTWIMMLWH